MNEVHLIGRLTKDPEIRTFGEGKAVANITLAIDDGRDKDGNKQTVFVNCEIWNNQAVILEKYSGKGCRLIVNGSLKQNSWEKDGQKHSTLLVRARTISFIDYKDSSTAEAEKKETNDISTLTREDVPF